MTLTPQLAQQCLEALEYHVAQTRPIDRTSAAILALREALASGEGDEARDAARYRWLRSGDYPYSFAHRVLNDTPHGIDAAIDTAMKGNGK